MNDRINEPISAKEMVTANGVNIFPSRPVRLNNGRNTTMIIKTPLMTGVATSSVARYTRCKRFTPLGAWANWVWMFSTTTTAASTSMPMAIARPPSDIRLALMPNRRIMMKVNSTDSGRIKATVSAARRLPSIMINTSSTRMTASPSAFSTVHTAAVTSSVRS